MIGQFPLYVGSPHSRMHAQRLPLHRLSPIGLGDRMKALTREREWAQMAKTVMQVALSLDVGGLERVILNLVQNASNEFRLVVCCLEQPGAWADLSPSVVAFGKRPGVDWRLFS